MQTEELKRLENQASEARTYAQQLLGDRDRLLTENRRLVAESRQCHSRNDELLRERSRHWGLEPGGSLKWVGVSGPTVGWKPGDGPTPEYQQQWTAGCRGELPPSPAPGPGITEAEVMKALASQGYTGAGTLPTVCSLLRDHGLLRTPTGNPDPMRPSLMKVNPDDYSLLVIKELAVAHNRLVDAVGRLEKEEDLR